MTWSDSQGLEISIGRLGLGHLFKIVTGETSLTESNVSKKLPCTSSFVSGLSGDSLEMGVEEASLRSMRGSDTTARFIYLVNLNWFSNPVKEPFNFNWTSQFYFFITIFNFIQLITLRK